MSKMIQVRNVPDSLHKKLKVRAATEGVSLSDYILNELSRLADRLSREELVARIGTLVREDLDPAPAELIRAERDGR